MKRHEHLVGYVAPVFAALDGWLFLDDVICVQTVLGFASIAAGFTLVKRTAIRDALGEGVAPATGD